MRVLIILFLGFLFNCSSQEEAATYEDGFTSGPQRINGVEWQKYQSTNRFNLYHPKGWKVRFSANTGKVTVAGRKYEKVVIWPFFAQNRLDESSAQMVLYNFAEKTFPEMNWASQPQMLARGSLKLIGRSGDQRAVVCLTWMNSNRGTAGNFYLVSAPQKEFDQQQAVFIEILRSFTITGSPTGPSVPRSVGPAGLANLQFVRWQDPKENAFSMEVPRGWNVEGGTVRVSPIDVRPYVKVSSRDNKVIVFWGDANIPHFTNPNSILAMSGLGEGSWYAPGYGTRLFVLRYQPGVNFAMHHVPTMLRGLSNFQFRGTRARPDIIRAVQAISARYNSPMISQNMHAGETFFTCQAGGRNVIGYAFSRTSLVEGYGIGQWHVEYFTAYFSAPEREMEARQILARMNQSYRVNMQWARAQQGVTGAVSNIVAETSNYMSNVFTQTFNANQSRMADVFQRGSMARRGVERVRDQRTGQVYEIQSGSNYNWIDAQQNIVGTNSHFNPNGLQFEEMIRLDR